MRFIVTGATGQLGKALVRKLQLSSCDFVTVRHSEILDFTENYQSRGAKTTIIHCAANTNVEQCQSNLLKTLHENYVPTISLVELAKEISAKFVYISSIGLYKDSEQPSTECAEVVTENHHHFSKYQSENYIRAHLHSQLIIRTGWLFSRDRENPKNFITRILNEAKVSDKLYANIEQFGMPTAVDFVADAVIGLIEKNTLGTVNVVQDPIMSRYDFVNLILGYSGDRENVTLKKVTNSHFNRISKVNMFEIASNELLKSLMPQLKFNSSTYLTEILKV